VAVADDEDKDFAAVVVSTDEDDEDDEDKDIAAVAVSTDEDDNVAVAFDDEDDEDFDATVASDEDDEDDFDAGVASDEDDKDDKDAGYIAVCTSSSSSSNDAAGELLTPCANRNARFTRISGVKGRPAWADALAFCFFSSTF
jgi:hypothetical protein